MDFVSVFPFSVCGCVRSVSLFGLIVKGEKKKKRKKKALDTVEALCSLMTIASF